MANSMDLEAQIHEFFGPLDTSLTKRAHVDEMDHEEGRQPKQGIPERREGSGQASRQGQRDDGNKVQTIRSFFVSRPGVGEAGAHGGSAFPEAGKHAAGASSRHGVCDVGQIVQPLGGGHHDRGGQEAEGHGWRCVSAAQNDGQTSNAGSAVPGNPPAVGGSSEKRRDKSQDTPKRAPGIQGFFRKLELSGLESRAPGSGGGHHKAPHAPERGAAAAGAYDQAGHSAGDQSLPCHQAAHRQHDVRGGHSAVGSKRKTSCRSRAVPGVGQTTGQCGVPDDRHPVQEGGSASHSIGETADGVSLILRRGFVNHGNHCYAN